MSAAEVIANLERYVNNTHQRMIAAAQWHAVNAEEQMKLHAPWTDRTGNARGSLRGVVEVTPVSIIITLSGGMPYSANLELNNSGRYAIIYPTAERTHNALMDDVRRIRSL